MILTKKLSKIGTSSALILDKTLLQLLGITGKDEVAISVQEKGLLIQAAPKEVQKDNVQEKQERMEKALHCTMKKYDSVYKRLSQS